MLTLSQSFEVYNRGLFTSSSHDFDISREVRAYPNNSKTLLSLDHFRVYDTVSKFVTLPDSSKLSKEIYSIVSSTPKYARNFTSGQQLRTFGFPDTYYGSGLSIKKKINRNLYINNLHLDSNTLLAIGTVFSVDRCF